MGKRRLPASGHHRSPTASPSRSLRAMEALAAVPPSPPLEFLSGKHRLDRIVREDSRVHSVQRILSDRLDEPAPMFRSGNNPALVIDSPAPVATGVTLKQWPGEWDPLRVTWQSGSNLASATHLAAVDARNCAILSRNSCTSAAPRPGMRVIESRRWPTTTNCDCSTAPRRANESPSDTTPTAIRPIRTTHQRAVAGISCRQNHPQPSRRALGWINSSVLAMAASTFPRNRTLPCQKCHSVLITFVNQRMHLRQSIFDFACRDVTQPNRTDCSGKTL